MNRVKSAVNKFIQGYNANPKHTSSISIAISINNHPAETNCKLPITVGEYSAHGAAFKNMVESGKVTNIYAGIDAELDWNTAELTRAWVNGFTNDGNKSIRLYNFGDHAGILYDFSGETDPVINDDWKASDIHYISWGNKCSYCFPQIYVEDCAKQWAYQKKWKGLYFEGVMSCNAWSNYTFKNQQSYNRFNYWLSNVGLGESIEYRSWIALPPPAQVN